MKKLTKNILNAINLDIPTLTEDSEGKLRGGFVAPDDPLGWPAPAINQVCGNTDCLNIPCTNPSCPNKICPTTKSTASPSDCISNMSMLI